MAFGVRTNCLSNVPPTTSQNWKIFLKKLILWPFTLIISYVKHVLDLLCVFFNLFGCFLGGGGGGAPKGTRAQPAYAVFQPR